MFWVGLVIGLIVGIIFGVFVIAICQAAANGDRMMGEEDNT